MAIRKQAATSSKVDLSFCDKEPIHLVKDIQPQGLLFVLDESLNTILQVSCNVREFYANPEDILGRPLSEVLPNSLVQSVSKFSRTASMRSKPYYMQTLQLVTQQGSRMVDAVIHRSNQSLILELEFIPKDGSNLPEPFDFYTDTYSSLRDAGSVQALCHVAVEKMKELTGFDRVMIYKFDEDDSGLVVAESCNPGLESYLGLHYPASDIPKQARELYLQNWVRAVPDIHAETVPIEPYLNPIDGQPLDQSYCILRSLSPVHKEYLKNMGVSSSLSISIIRGGKLWGLIACHHAAPKYIAYKLRLVCEFFGQIFSSQLGNQEEIEAVQYHLKTLSAQEEILQRFIQDRDFVKTFYMEGARLIELLDHVEGMALSFEGNCYLYGETPSRAKVKILIDWLQRNNAKDMFYTDSLSDFIPEAEAYRDVASGVLSISIAQSRGDYLLWFRPEIIRTVYWAGDPDKPVTMEEGSLRLSPRKSFELWKETVLGKSIAWKQGELESIAIFRNYLLNIVLTQAINELSIANAQLAQSNADLEQFASVASHDLQAPLRKAKTFAEQVLSEKEKLSLENQDALCRFQNAIQNMQNLIRDLLELSRVSKVKRTFEPVDIAELMKCVLSNLELLIQEKQADIQCSGLQVVLGDPVQLGQLLQNLIENGIKYQPIGQKPIISVCMDKIGERITKLEVEDNGIGFNQEDADRIFEPFERLHGKSSIYPGTGIGLAICKRIVEQHGGTLTVESHVGVGSKFICKLPA